LRAVDVDQCRSLWRCLPVALFVGRQVDMRIPICQFRKSSICENLAEYAGIANPAKILHLTFAPRKLLELHRYKSGAKFLSSAPAAFDPLQTLA
jgi:hypothetical protein